MKHSIHDDQMFNRNPASLVHLTQNLSSIAKQIATYKSPTKFSSYSEANLAALVSKSFNSNHAPRLRFTPNQLVLAQQNSGQIIRAKNTHTTNTKIAYHTYLQPNCPALAARTANTFHSALQKKFSDIKFRQILIKHLSFIKSYYNFMH